MKPLRIVLLFAAIFFYSSLFAQKWSIDLHGGAGNMSKEKFTQEQIDTYKKELQNALEIGKNILANGGTSLDAVEQVVRYLEDCPLFNAGKGAVFTHDGKNELDASIMEGRNLAAGAVAGVGDIKNPIVWPFGDGEIRTCYDGW
jgi:beta-aspartyl-peptidase (threonine type)